MTRAYPAASIAAARVRPHYSTHLAAGKKIELIPSIEEIESIIDVAFWASLRREEGYPPKISLAYVAPAMVDGPLIFARPVRLESGPLTRLAPAVERPGIHLCVWPEDGELVVWGTARHLPEFSFVLEVISPGLLVIKHSRGDDSGKFVNIAVLQGDELKMIDQRAVPATECPELLTSMLDLQAELHAPDSANVLIQLAVSMRAHGRGGSLLVVPASSGEWRESILQPINYAITPAFSALVDLMGEDPEERIRRRWQEGLRRVVDSVAGLTAVDGATVINDRHEVLAFGAKITRRNGCDRVSRVVVTEPVEGTTGVIVDPSQLGGTRHLSAAQFAHDQRQAIALVASQDGAFTVFGWSPCEDIVHAHRIDTLLL